MCKQSYSPIKLKINPWSPLLTLCVHNDPPLAPLPGIVRAHAVEVKEGGGGDVRVGDTTILHAKSFARASLKQTLCHGAA